MRPAILVATLLLQPPNKTNKVWSKALYRIICWGRWTGSITSRVLGPRGATSLAAIRQGAWRSYDRWSKRLRRSFSTNERTAIPAHCTAPPERITNFLKRDIGASSHVALVSGLECRSCRKTRSALICVPQPMSTMPSGMHLVAKRSLSRSASSAPTFNPI